MLLTRFKSGDWYGDFLHQRIASRSVVFLLWWRETDAWGSWSVLWGPADTTGLENCWVWEGPLEITWSNLPAPVGPGGDIWPGLCPVKFWLSPNRRDSTSSTCASVSLLSHEKNFLTPKRNFLCFNGCSLPLVLSLDRRENSVHVSGNSALLSLVCPSLSYVSVKKKQVAIQLLP